MKTLKYAWRFLIRSKSYTVINLLGLAFSLACCIMLMRYIHRELTVDTHCIDREHVYGVIQDMDGTDKYPNLEVYADPESDQYQEMIRRICSQLKFTTLRYHRLDDMIESVGLDKDKLCTYCWDGRE